ncbi:MAG: ATP-binding protein [Bacteroidales bacterium]|nr:ATP-binding protein [Bacteroidales bacterium]
MKQQNPFLIEGYLTPKFFCDRVQETAVLDEHIHNQRNVALIAKRRLGKSGMIHNYFYQPNVKEQFYTFYIDIYDTKNLQEFTYELGKGILNTLKSIGRKALESFLTILKSLKTGISFDINGVPEWNLSIGEMQMPDVMLDEIFMYLERADKPCIVAIDEFQVIADYPEKNIEAALRKRIQTCHNAQFIYSGSKRHMMTEMFATQSRPFYNSAVLMGLDAIEESVYHTFANHHLQENRQQIGKEAFHYLYDRFDGTTWYIQYVLNMLYADKRTDITFDNEDVDNAIQTIVQHNSFAYRSLLFLLSPKQKMVLRAIAQEGKVEGIMTQRFLHKYHLTSSVVQGASKVLLDKDMITNEEGTYYIYDYFMQLWLKGGE